jgi:hypothetical protein
MSEQEERKRERENILKLVKSAIVDNKFVVSNVKIVHHQNIEIFKSYILWIEGKKKHQSYKFCLNKQCKQDSDTFWIKLEKQFTINFFI